MAAASLQDADPESPLLRSHPPLPLPMCEETGQEGGRCGLPSPPAPLPRCRRGVSRGRGIVARCRRRVATAPLPSPSSAPRVGGDGAGGKVRTALTPSPSPALRERGESWPRHRCKMQTQNHHCSAPIHLFRSQCVRRRGKGEGADCPHPQPLSRAAGEG